MKPQEYKFDQIYKILKNAICTPSEKKNFKRIEQKAEAGDVFSQLVLGDIYFYGITADDKYWNDLDKTIALAKYSKKKSGRKFGLLCPCNTEPNYTAALRWYKMAAQNGSEDAKRKIEKIQSGLQLPHKNMVIQTIEIDCKY